MGGRHQSKRTIKYVLKDVKLGVQNIRIRQTAEEAIEENEKADTVVSFFIREKWTLLIAYVLLWIIKIILESRGDIVTAVALASGTTAMSNIGFSMIVASIGMLSQLFFALSISNFYNLSAKGIDDVFKHVVLLITSFVMALASAPVSTLMTLITVEVILFSALRASRRRSLRKGGAKTISSKKHVTTSKVVLNGAIYGIPAIVLFGGMWLPAENITTSDNKTFSAYVIASDNDNSSLLVQRDRRMVIYRNEKITGRQICTDRKVDSLWARPLLYVVSHNHVKYPFCINE